MSDRRPDVPAPAGRAVAPSFGRRRMLLTTAAVVTLPAVLAACTPGSGQQTQDATDAMLALADGARRDAAVVAAAVTGDPALAERLEPLRAARMEHATALDQAAGRTPGSAPVPATPPSANLAAVRDTITGSVAAAREVVPRASAMQVGLVAEIAACCAAYADDLGTPATTEATP